MKILVTGGAGFIGSHIVEYFHNKAEVCVLDNLYSGFESNLSVFHHKFFEASILERQAVRRAMDGVDFVFHLAAIANVPESIQNPVECWDVNVCGTLIVLEEAARAKVKKVVLSSSAAIYGSESAAPKVETMLPQPKSPYAFTKLEGERYCQVFTREQQLATVCLRYFNVFGPRQNANSPYAAAVAKFIDRALENETIIIHGDGEQTRDFVFVRDIVSANVFFALQSGVEGVFNVASGRHITINNLARTICEITGSHSTITHTGERPGDVKHSQACIDKLRAAGFVPTINLDDGLQATVNFFRQRKMC